MKRRPQALQPFRHRHLRHVPEIARGRRHRIPMAGAELFGQEARHRRLALQRQHRPQAFAHHADGVGHAERQVLVHFRGARCAQQAVEHVAHRPRLAVADEVGLARAGRARGEMIEGIEMRLRGIVDEGGVDLVAAAADDAQAPGLRAFDQTRQDLVVARAPDQARAQGDGREAGIVGRQHRFLGDGLGGRVRCLEVFAVGHGLGGAAFDRMGRAMGDAGRGGVDQPADAVCAAGLQHVLRADHVGLVITVVAAPGAGFRGVVEHRVETARECRHHRVAVGKIARDLLHADGIERRVMAAIETGDVMPARDQPAAQGLPEETAAAGHQNLHALSSRAWVAAHAASFSRPILALWRISTGNGFG